MAKDKTRIIDSLNRLQQDIGGTTYTTAPTSAITQYGYDNNGNLTTTTDPLSRVTTNAYDALNRLTSVIDPYNGATKPTLYSYDKAGNLETVTDPQGLVTSYLYNGHNNLLTQTSPDTGATQFTYNAQGNVKTRFDAMNRCSLTTYDNLHRATAIRYFAATNANTNTATGCAAATTSTTTVEETIAYTYDSITATLGGPGGKGRLSRVSDAGGRIDYVYDKNGRITSKAQVTTGATNATKTVTYSYNAFGQLSQMTTPSGQTITYVYGPATSNQPGKLVQIQLNGTDIIKGGIYEPFGPNGGWSWGNHNGTTLINQHLRVFDLDYRPTAIASDPEGYNRNITWDQANRITGITVPGTSGGVPTITIPGVTNALSVNQSYGYDALDRLTSMNPGYPGATTPATGQALLPIEAFTYDAIGNRLTRTSTPPGASAATATYAYPNTSATPPANRRHILNAISGAQVNAYTYDATGNTLTESAALALMNPSTGVVNTGSTSSPLTYTYNAKGRLKVVQIGATSTDTVTYKINGLGQRYQKVGAGLYVYSTSSTVNTTTGLSPQAASLNFNARHVHDEQGRLLGEYSPEGKLISETVWFDDLPVATIRPKGANNQIPLGIAGTGATQANNVGNNTPANKVNTDIYYLHADHLGTPRVATRSVAVGGATTGPNAVNKAVWRWDSDPFGTSLDSLANLWRIRSLWLGRHLKLLQLVSGLTIGFLGRCLMGNLERHITISGDYDPTIGRYVESDPIGLLGGANTFSYVESNPVGAVDPRGLRGYVQYPRNAMARTCVGRIVRSIWDDVYGDGSWSYPVNNTPFNAVLHCHGVCRMQKECGNLRTIIATLGHELIDADDGGFFVPIIRDYSDSMNDFHNNDAGLECARSQRCGYGRKNCLECCYEKLRSGDLRFEPRKPYVRN